MNRTVKFRINYEFYPFLSYIMLIFFVRKDKSADFRLTISQATLTHSVLIDFHLPN